MAENVTTLPNLHHYGDAVYDGDDAVTNTTEAGELLIYAVDSSTELDSLRDTYMTMAEAGALMGASAVAAGIADSTASYNAVILGDQTDDGLTTLVLDQSTAIIASGGLGTTDIVAESATVSGAITAASVAATGAVTAASVTASGAITAASVTASGNIVSTGGAVSAVSGSFSDDVTVKDTLTATGVTATSVTASGAVTAASVTASGTVTAGTLKSTGNVTASGNVTGANVTASGAVSAASVAASGAITAASVTASGAVSAASVAASGEVSAASVTASGAVTAESVAASGAVTAESVTASGDVVGAFCASGLRYPVSDLSSAAYAIRFNMSNQLTAWTNNTDGITELPNAFYVSTESPVYGAAFLANAYTAYNPDGVKKTYPTGAQIYVYNGFGSAMTVYGYAADGSGLAALGGTVAAGCWCLLFLAGFTSGGSPIWYKVG